MKMGGGWVGWGLSFLGFLVWGDAGGVGWGGYGGDLILFFFFFF